MIEVSIAHDKALNSLSDFAQLLYLKILPHTDDWGRFEGDPEIVKARVEPLSKKPVAKYNAAMQEIAAANLWVWYRTDKGKMVLQYNADSFERINAFLIKSRKNYEYPPHKDSYELICGDMSSISHRETKVESKEQKAESKEKLVYGEFKNVFLTIAELGSLQEKLGSQRCLKAIEILSAYKESKGKTYKSDFATFRTWVVAELEKREAAHPVRVKYDKPKNNGNGRIAAKLLCERHNLPYSDGEMCVECKKEFDSSEVEGTPEAFVKAMNTLADRMTVEKKATDPNERFRCPECNEIHARGFKCSPQTKG